MKKVLFSLLLLTIFFVGINVKAKYSSYETGDMVVINGNHFVVIEDSDSNTEKLKLMDMYPLFVSNGEEIMDECSVYNEDDDDDDDIQLEEAIYNKPPIIDVQCVTEHAKFCTEYSDECRPLMIPFESRELEEDEELVYNENSPTNVGYFLKNKVTDYYKNILEYNNVKVRLLTADEQISYFIKTNMMIGGRLMSQYGQFQNIGCRGIRKGEFKSSKEAAVSNFNYPLFGQYLVDSLKYTKECGELVSYTFYDDLSTSEYYYPSMIRPVIEVSKKEFSYELTKEKEGDGTLELETNNNYKAGDYVVINDIPYLIISNKNGQVRLYSTVPVSVSNYNEMEEECDRYIDYENYNSDNTELVNCILEHAKYCSPEDKNCEALYLPFNYNDISNHTYNPNLETNVGHYIKNELKDIIQEGFGDKYNIIDVDVLTYDEMIELSESGIIPIFNVGSLKEPVLIPSTTPTMMLKQSTIYSNDLQQSPYLDTILNYNDNLDELDYAIDDFGEIYPVITVSVDDLPVNAKAGSTVTVTTEPEEGYELVELTVTDDDNNKVIYTPTTLARRERGTYTFKMTSANAHVYAKFIPIQTYSAKSLSEELTIDDGLDKLSGVSVKYRIRLNAGDTLKGIVYYDEERNEVEVPFEEENGEYTFDMPAMNVFLRAIIQYADPVYNLYGKDVTIPVQKSEEGGILTFTVDGTKVIKSITYKLEDGTEIHPYYSVNNGTYSIVMPANDVFVSVEYMESNAQGDAVVPEEKDIDKVPITGDNIYKSIMYLTISLIILGLCFVAHKKNNPRKKVLIPYDMV